MQEVKGTGSILRENTLRFSSNPHFKPGVSPFPHQYKGRPFLTQRKKKKQKIFFQQYIFLELLLLFWSKIISKFILKVCLRTIVKMP